MGSVELKGFRDEIRVVGRGGKDVGRLFRDRPETLGIRVGGGVIDRKDEKVSLGRGQVTE